VNTGTVWALIALCAAVTAVIKAAGPVALGGRDLPEAFSSVIKLMAPALLAALVCVQIFSDGDRWAVSEDTVGVAVAGVALWRGASVVIGVVLAAVVTAGLRAI
jgi:branched-subunit amino acid transport protein